MEAARPSAVAPAALPVVQATLSAAPPDPAVALAVQRVAAPRAAVVAAPAPLAAAPPPTPLAVTPPPPPAAPSSPPAGDDDPTWRRLQAVMRLHRAKAGEAESPLATTDAPQGPPSAPAQAPAAAPTIQRQAAPPPTASPPPALPLVAPLPVADVALPAPEPSQPSAGPPLEAVWPVERRPSPAISPAPIQRRSADRADVAPPGAGHVDAAHEDTVRQRLGDVAVGQPTRSSVELIPPRRPRPAPVAALPPAPRRAGGATDLIPTEIGPLALAQPFADTVKAIFKEIDGLLAKQPEVGEYNQKI